MPILSQEYLSVIEDASCVVHIGVPKTGSTALEVFLGANRAALGNDGILYPAFIERGFAHHDLAFLVSGGYPEWATPQERSLDELLHALRMEVGAHPRYRRLILSSENFYWLAPPEKVRDLLAGLGHAPDRVAIVVYVRRQEDAIESWYNQIVKAQGYAGTFRQCIAEFDALWDYSSRLARWADVFGHERIVLRTYPDDSGTAFDVRHDFTGLLGLDPARYAYAPERPNQRLLRDLLEFQRTINQLPLGTIDKRRFHKQLIALSHAAPDSLLADAPLHTRATRQSVCDRYAAGNRQLARRHFGREMLFPAVAAPDPADAAPPSPLSAEKLACIFAWLIMSQPRDQ